MVETEQVKATINSKSVLQALKQHFEPDTKFSLLAVSPNGTVSIHTSDIFKSYLTSWYPEKLYKEAANCVKLQRQKPLRASFSIPSPDEVKAQTWEDKVRSSRPTDTPGRQSLAEIQTPPSDGSKTPVETKMSRIVGSSATTSPQRLKVSTVDHTSRRQVSSLKKGRIDAPGEPVAPKKRKRVRMRQASNASSKCSKIIETQEIEVNDSKAIGSHDGQKDDDSYDSEDNDTSDSSEDELLPLCVSRYDDVTDFLHQRFVQLQQLDCKTVAKCWIRVIEPKKQSHNPYNKGNATRPQWWPQSVQHREPDHLLRGDRVNLLVALIRLKGCPIAELRAATDESPQLLPCKKELLSEVYTVIEMEQQYKDNQIGDDYCHYIRASPRRFKRARKATKSRRKSSLKTSNMSPKRSSSPQTSISDSLRSNLPVNEEEGIDDGHVKHDHHSPSSENIEQITRMVPPGSVNEKTSSNNSTLKHNAPVLINLMIPPPQYSTQSLPNSGYLSAFDNRVCQDNMSPEIFPTDYIHQCSSVNPSSNLFSIENFRSSSLSQDQHLSPLSSTGIGFGTANHFSVDVPYISRNAHLDMMPSDSSMMYSEHPLIPFSGEDIPLSAYQTMPDEQIVAFQNYTNAHHLREESYDTISPRLCQNDLDLQDQISGIAPVDASYNLSFR